MTSLKNRLIAGLLTTVGLALPLAATPLLAEVRLPHSFSNHGVLQREAPIHIWGWASPGESVTVTMLQQHRTTVADPLGQWPQRQVRRAMGQQGVYDSAQQHGAAINGHIHETTVT